MARFTMLAALLAVASALTNGPLKAVQQKIKLMKPIELSKLPAAASALSVSLYAQAASAKSVIGVNGALDFGPLAGDQPGGEGTGKALGINDDSLLFALGAVVLAVGFAFAQWQEYQDDDDDFFDSYDSRRADKEITNRNRV